MNSPSITRRAVGSRGRAAALLPTAVAVLAVAAVTVTGALVAPASIPAAEPQELGGSSRLICPAGDAAFAASTEGAPEFTLTALRANASSGSAPRPTVTDGVLGTGRHPWLVLDASGAAAAGTTAVTTVSDAAALDRSTCTDAGTDSWLLVPAAVSDDIRLQLANSETDAASVNVTVYTADGQQPAPGGTGIPVAAESVVSRQVSDWTPADAPAVAIRVQSATGRVAAWLTTADAKADPATWGASVAATTSQLLPGLPGGAGTRQLVVMNPGERRAQVQVQALGPDGVYTPAGAADGVDVGAGAVAVLELDEGFSRVPVTLRLDSTQPVLAAVGASGDQGRTVVTSAVPQAGAAVVPGADVTSDLVLTNTGDSSSDVTITPLAGGRSRTVTVAAASTLTVSKVAGARIDLPDDLQAATVLTASKRVASSAVLPASTSSGTVIGLDPRIG